MKRFFTYIIAIAATALILTSCKEHCEVDNISVFELSQSEFQISNIGETVSVKVASKVNWTAKTTEDWIRLKAEDIESVDGRDADKDFASTIAAPFNTNRAGGYVKVEIEITENPTATSRNGEITFTTSDMQTFTVSVTQTAGADDSIDIDDMEGDDDFDKETKTLHFTAEGGEKSINFTVTREWTASVAEDAEWCSISPEDGEGGKQTITITAQPTDTTAERTTKVTITSGDAAVVITVVQDGMDNIDIDDMEGDDDFDKETKTLHFTAEGGEKTLGFTVTREWTASVAEDAEWCSISPEDGERGKQTITISAQPTDQFEERSTSVTITSGTASVTITIVQDGDPTIMPEDMERAFPDPIFRAYVMENFDTDKDGKISREEAEKVKSIDVSKSSSTPDNEKIASLEGVQYFTNLTSLSCYYNKLTELDVTHNTALTYLSCSLNQLETLNVSGCYALTSLNCDANQLTELDVTHNPALAYLSCSLNQLTELDVTHNSALDRLLCDSNRLTELDVTQNTALTCLSCSSNQLTELDVTQNDALTDLTCYINQLADLDVTQNTKLTDLRCSSNQLRELDVAKNTAITYLSCDSNQLTELDVTQNPALWLLNCDGNQLTELYITQNTALKYLYCDSNQLTELDVSNNPQLELLYCYSNPLETLYMKQGQSIKTLSKPNSANIQYIN